jgi:hypothetical protein
MWIWFHHMRTRSCHYASLLLRVGICENARLGHEIWVITRLWSCLDYSNGMFCSRCFTNYGHCLFFSTGQNSQYDFHDPRDAPWSIQYTRTQTKLSRVAVEKQRYEIDPPFAGSDVTTVALGITSCRCKTERLQRSQDRML